MSFTTNESRWYSVTETELGELTLVRDTSGLRGVYFPHHWYRPHQSTFGSCRDEGFDDVRNQLSQYLGGERTQFVLPLSVRGDSLQLAVWQLIAQIPYGTTVTYGQLAGQIGGTITAQQVGAAVGRNPLSIVVPCHRVVGHNGKLTGYAGGVTRKRYLLDLEREHLSHRSATPFQEPLIPLTAHGRHW